MPHIRIRIKTHIKNRVQNGAEHAAEHGAQKTMKAPATIGSAEASTYIRHVPQTHQTSHQAKKKGAGNACAFHNFD